MDRPRPHLGSAPAEAVWERAIVGLAFIDREGHWLRVNGAFCQTLRYTEEELRRTTFQAVTIPGDVDADVHMAALVAERKIEEYTMYKTYLAKGERPVRVVVTKRGIFDPVTDEFMYFYVQCTRDEYIDSTDVNRVVAASAGDGWSPKDLASWLWENKKQFLSWMGGIAVAMYAVYQLVANILHLGGGSNP